MMGWRVVIFLFTEGKVNYLLNSDISSPDCRTIDRNVPKGISLPCIGTITVRTGVVRDRYFACDHFCDTK